MNPAKSALLAGALTILTSTLASEWATSSRAAIADQIPFAALIAAVAGLIIWLTGCVMICRKASAAALFGGGAAMLIFLSGGGSIVDHLWPSIGVGALLVPMAACFIGGMMFIVVGIFRSGSN
ncbi:MAG TPA: hypothetical protein VKT71_06075 [Candidatus Acidoferrales bacterium]|nr:hypothetical protein [Candidatus Acidoferrales bacterium]